MTNPAQAPASERVLLDAEALERTLHRIAHEIIEGNPDLEQVALVGIHTRGVSVAQRLRALIEQFAGTEVALGHARHHVLPRRRPRARPRGAAPPAAGRARDRGSTSRSRGRPCVLVDDVLYTGRTIRAAIEALFDYGRPAAVRLAVLCDRGHRELPIRPDYVGKNLPTSRGERVQVQLVEVDEVDQVVLVPAPEEESH